MEKYYLKSFFEGILTLGNILNKFNPVHYVVKDMQIEEIKYRRQIRNITSDHRRNLGKNIEEKFLDIK